MTTIRVGAQIQPQHAEYRQMRDTWLRVEEMGGRAVRRVARGEVLG